MPYIIKKVDGKKFGLSVVFTRKEIERIASMTGSCVEVVNTTTRRKEKYGCGVGTKGSSDLNGVRKPKRSCLYLIEDMNSDEIIRRFRSVKIAKKFISENHAPREGFRLKMIKRCKRVK